MVLCGEPSEDEKRITHQKNNEIFTKIMSLMHKGYAFNSVGVQLYVGNFADVLKSCHIYPRTLLV